MKKIAAIVLLLFITVTLLCSCSSNNKLKVSLPEERTANILFIGDDLMESGKVYYYFDALCKENDKNVTVSHFTFEDARLYTFADLCKEDKSFSDALAEADLLIFEEGTAETATTVESLNKILEYARDDISVVCLSLYGYPVWMYRELFENTTNKLCYADANYFIGKIIAHDDAPLGYEHLVKEDYRHPNELNGYITALVTYCEVFDTMPEWISNTEIENDNAISVYTPKDISDTKELLTRISDLITAEMKQ